MSPDFEHPARQAWREAVVEIAEKAKATLPAAVNGRIEKALALVLAGDVQTMGDGTARVASQSNGQMIYRIVNGHCDCKDYPQAFEGWCKHRLGHAIAKRATALAKQKLAQLDGAIAGQAEPPSPPAPPPASPAPLPEAPASVNVHVELAGRQVQLTLRDRDETRLLARLEAVLQRFPLAGKPTEAQGHPEGWCRTHGVPMKAQHKDGRTWYSHFIHDAWCKGK
jgi:hypothetical protein